MNHAILRQVGEMSEYVGYNSVFDMHVNATLCHTLPPPGDFRYALFGAVRANHRLQLCRPNLMEVLESPIPPGVTTFPNHHKRAIDLSASARRLASPLLELPAPPY